MWSFIDGIRGLTLSFVEVVKNIKSMTVQTSIGTYTCIKLVLDNTHLQAMRDKMIAYTAI